jgi:hypothetical protein
MSLPLRAAMMMPMCALAVHQLRFELATGSQAQAQLAREGHGYLSTLEPFVLLAAATALGAFAGAVARAWDGQEASQPRRHSLARVWLLCALVLVALYCGQELAEGILLRGHPGGVAGVFGHGGLLAVPISVLVAAALALALRTADAVLRLVARARAHRRIHVSPEHGVAIHMRPGSSDWRLEPQAGVVAGRAPPLALP